MAIKSGSITHFGGNTLMSRLQTAGPSSVNIPETKIYELGNEQTVATVRDAPDLQFDLESLDMTCAIETMLTRQGSISTGEEFSFINAKPLDVVSPYKDKYGTFESIAGLIFPALVLESAQYRFGVKANATQSFSLKGDSIYYCQSTPYFKSFAGAGAGPYAFDHTAVKTVEDGDDVYAYGVCVHYADGSYLRLFHGIDYTDTNAHVTLLDSTVAPVGSTVEVVYASTTQRSLPQSMHPDTDVTPAAIRSHNIDVYVSNGAATPTIARWTSVQSVEANWRVTLEKEEELGNTKAVSQDYDVPDVTGSVVLRPTNPLTLMAKIAQVAGVSSSTETINALSSVALALEIRISNDDGDRLKTLYVPDARFQPPAPQGRVQQKSEVTLPFTSDSGTLLVYAGVRP